MEAKGYVRQGDTGDGKVLKGHAQTATAREQGTEIRRDESNDWCGAGWPVD